MVLAAGARLPRAPISHILHYTVHCIPHILHYSTGNTSHAALHSALSIVESTTLSLNSELYSLQGMKCRMTWATWATWAIWATVQHCFLGHSDVR